MLENMFVAIICVLIIIWIWYIQFYRISTDHQIFVDDLINHEFLKTGDLIVFKAYNNFNSIFIGSYFGHVGVVCLTDMGPMLFEANGIEKVPLKPHHSTKGIFMTPLADRIKKYKGRCFWKPLNRELSSEIISEFDKFTKICLDHFYYDYKVLIGGLKRLLGLEKCGFGTDCGQMVFLSLIKMGLIDLSEYEKNIAHQLRYVCNITELLNGYKYMPLIEVIDHPFAE